MSGAVVHPPIVAGAGRARAVSWQRAARRVAVVLGALVLIAWTVFPFLWILLTSLKAPGDILSVPPKFLFEPTLDNYAALVMGEQRGQYASTRPDFPRFFLNSLIISIGAVALSVAAGIPAAYALARFDFKGKETLAFIFMSFRFVPFIAFVIPLYLIYQKIVCGWPPCLQVEFGSSAQLVACSRVSGLTARHSGRRP